MKRHQQVITLAVDFDLASCPPPENWDWAEVGRQLNNSAAISVVAAGPVERQRPPTGFALAMEVLQSDLYCKLNPDVQQECDALIAQGQERI